jgi:hypothetical protein
MKTFFTFFIALFLGFSTWSDTNKSDGKKAILSYALPSKLNWKQATDDIVSGTQSFTLKEDEDLTLNAIQVGNDLLWPQFANQDKEKIFQELSSGKKSVHKDAGITNWKADKNQEKKSDSEIIFEITGSYTQEQRKKLFIEKYYVTPYGFVLISLKWTDKSKSDLVKKAQAEFKNASFKTEIK